MKLKAVVYGPKYTLVHILKKGAVNIKKSMTTSIRGIARRAFQKRVANWTDRPIIATRYSKPPGTFGQMLVFPIGPDSAVNKWLWVSFGTKRHVITPTNAPELRFRLGYIRKTWPGDVYGRTGGFAVGPLSRRQKVMHPGIKARDFENHIKKEIINKVETRLQKALLQDYEKLWPMTVIFKGPRMSIE